MTVKIVTFQGKKENQITLFFMFQTLGVDMALLDGVTSNEISRRTTHMVADIRSWKQ